GAHSLFNSHLIVTGHCWARSQLNVLDQHGRPLFGAHTPKVAMASGTSTRTQIIASPRCQKCGARMLLVCASLDREDRDKRIYECARCQHEITEVVKLQKAG